MGVKINPPLMGLSQNRSLSEQEPGTTREARNVRAESPTTGREQIASRSGMKDFSTNGVAVAAAPARMATDITYDVPVMDYAIISDANLEGTSEWTKGSSSRAARNVVVDAQGASYWVFGKDTLMKINADGETVWCLSVPLKEETHVVRAMSLDSAGNLYVGSTADQDYSDSSFDSIPIGAVQENNQIWRIAQISDPENDEERAEIAGEWFAGGFVEDIVVKFGYVYYLQNRPDRFEAEVVIIQNFGVGTASITVQPTQLSQRIVPYPANSLAVNSIGEIIVASEPFNQRLDDPKYPELSRVSNLSKLPGMWTWRRNLDNAQGRGWSEINAAILSGQANGSAVTDLPDLDGLGRGFSFKSSISGDGRTFTAPTYIERGLGDAPVVRFNGVDNGLVSEPNISLDYRDRGGAQRTPWPSYGSHTGGVTDTTSAQFVLFFLARVQRESSKGAIFGQTSAGSDSPTYSLHTRNPFALVANRPESNDTAVAAVSGKITLWDVIRDSAGNFQSTFPPSGPDGTGSLCRLPREGDLLGIRSAPNNSADPEEPAAMLVTLVIDNGVTNGGLDLNETRCSLRLNGMPIDRWQGSIRISLDPVTMGFAANVGGDTIGTRHGFFNGDFVRSLCIAKSDPLLSPLNSQDVIGQQRTAPRSRIMSIFSTATSGTFTLTFHFPDGTADATTASMTFDEPATSVATKLEAVIGDAFDVSVNGGPNVDDTQVNVYIGWDEGTARPADHGEYYGISMPDFTINDSTGGGSVTITASTEIDAGYAEGGAIRALPHQPNPAILSDKEREMELIEGQIMHEQGLQHLLPQAGTPFAHPYALYPPVDPNSVDPTDLFSTNAIISKYSTGDLSLLWVTAPTEAAGFAVLVSDDDETIYSMGPGTNELTKYTDDGDSLTLDFTTGFVPSGFGDRHPRCALDEYGTWYIPRFPDTHVGMESLIAIQSDNTTLFYYNSSATEVDRLPTYAVAVAPNNLDYGKTAIERNEFLFAAFDPVAIGGGPNDSDTARKIKLVTSTHSGRSPRVTERIVVAGGTVKKDDGLGGYATISGGASLLDPLSPLVMGVRHQGKLYINDQNRTYVYDPKAGASGEISLHVATDGGMVPQRAHFIFSWQGKLGWARLDDQPGFLQLSRSAKASELNITPSPLFPGRAWKGSSSLDIGDAPDIINGIAPISNTLLAIFGDKSVHVIQGEPTFGGQITEAAHMVGGAYGKCWAWDKRERLFFMSNFGELYVLPIGGTPEPISDMRIKRSLQDIDFSTHYVYSEWNWLDETVHFFLIPYSGTPTLVSHYVLDTKRGKLAFWEDTFAITRQPTCVGIFDGDSPQDRRMVLGNSDGHIRVWDPDSSDDDAQPVDTSILYDLTPSGSETAYAFSELQVTLELDQDGCIAELIPAEHAGLLLEDQKSPSMELKPGYNAPNPTRIMGNRVYLRLRNGAPGSRFAVQEVMINASPAGPRRLRSTS